MYSNQIFALMGKQNDVLTINNLCICDDYEMANKLARACYGSDAIAADVSLYPVRLGDSYVDGIYYRDGAVIERNPTEAERIEALQAQQDAFEIDSTIVQADIIYDVSLLQLGL